MNLRQSSQNHMFEAVINYMNEWASKWQGIAKIVEVMTLLSQLYEAINAAVIKQENAKVPIGKTKFLLKKAIALKADILNDIVEAYANFENNDELSGLMSDSRSDLLKLPYDDMLRRVEVIIEKALELKDTLVEGYGMTEEQVTDLQNDVNQLLDISGKPRAYKIKVSVATTELEQLFNETNDLLNNRLDKLMSIFKNRDANFYNGYLKARVIVD